jgi:hypothetical protein
MDARAGNSERCIQLNGAIPVLVEIKGKGGRVCEQARTGKIKCPLMIRPTSEDVITSQLFGSLKCINPRWWLPDLINAGLGQERFRRQIFRDLQIDLWVKQKGVPARLVPWNEGQTEVDVVVSWSNPRTVLFVEMKYASTFSNNTVCSMNESEFPTDQLIRNIRIGLWKTGHYLENRLFDLEPSNFIMLLVSPRSDNPLVESYRSNQHIRRAIPGSDKIAPLPTQPFVGQVSFKQITRILNRNGKYLARSERSIADLLCNYLDLKLSHLKK